MFTAITDTIAWNVLPRALFQKLFRQDLLVASLFRNFLLAERIMRAANCNPVRWVGAAWWVVCAYLRVSGDRETRTGRRAADGQAGTCS